MKAGKIPTIGMSAPGTSTTGSKYGSNMCRESMAVQYLKQRLDLTEPACGQKRTGAIDSTQCSETMSPGFKKLLDKLTPKNKRRLAALYHYFVMRANQYGPAGAIRESKLNTWLGSDLRWGHLEWRQRNPYMDNEQMCRAMEYIYNRQQRTTHYRARMIYDVSEQEHAQQMTLHD